MPKALAVATVSIASGEHAEVNRIEVCYLPVAKQVVLRAKKGDSVLVNSMSFPAELAREIASAISMAGDVITTKDKAR